MTLSLFGGKSKVKAKGGGRFQAVNSVTEPGKCSAISDGDWTVFPYFLVLLYLSTLELIQISRDPIPYPPQMRNRGSPPAHLSLSLDSHAAVERAIATTAAAIKTAMDLALKKMFAAFAASWAEMSAELAASCAAVLAELVLATEQSC
jgi:hypothetical protein